MNRYARVIVDLPVSQPLDYRVADDGEGGSGPAEAATGNPEPSVGSLCVVPVGKRRQVGIVVGFSEHSAVEPGRLRTLGTHIPSPRLSASWLELCQFAADYYHYPWGEVALPALPPYLRRVPKARAAKAGRTARRGASAAAAAPDAQGELPPAGTPADGAADAVTDAAAADAAVVGPVALRDEQRAAIGAITQASGFAPFLLFGVTGSGKTEVYLGAIERALARSPGAQALLLVPEINLTPQLQSRLCARFPGRCVVSLHSALAPRDRAQAWMQAHEGRAQIILGTRTAVFASLPRLRLIVVDEEHDASFKAHGGVPYSARDLAVKRAQIEALPVVLGSATPSLETWYQACSGRYRLLTLVERGASGQAHALADPAIETIDLQHEAAEQGLAPTLRAALDQTLVRGEQALVFINRRGFAPVLRCAACEWLSRCPHCDAFAAYHKVGAALRCHHCGWNSRVPGACPDCGNQDLQGVGQGTQRVEETLRRLWPQARIARIDRDNTQGAQGANRASAAFDAVHAGDVDILVGTQMITKGHDFRRVTTVGVLNADAQLVAADFRAPERLFAVLMQVAGRAGRAGQASRVLIQTRYPRHPLFRALARASFSDFAQEQIAERRSARMPPFVHQALLTTSARTMEQALDFLRRCVALREGLAQAGAVTIYDPVPMPLARLAAESRGQLLVEAPRRADLHAFLDAWLPLLRAQGSRGVLRWGIEVDPQAI
jgi:primosomal protein N' (replication factor Y)